MKSLLGWFADPGTLGLPSHGSASETGLVLPRSAIPFAMMRGSSQHLLHRKCLEGNASGRQDQGVLFCHRDIEEKLANQRGKFTITKVIENKFELVGRYFLDKCLCV